MQQVLQVDGGVVCRRFDGGALTPMGRPDVSGPDGPADTPALEALKGWKDRYWHASIRNDAIALREIGAEMFGWLDTGGALGGWMKQARRVLQILPDDKDSAPDLASALLEAPWEVLHHKGFLAQDPSRLFVVSRRVLKAAEPWEPRHGDLRMMFMAAAPEGASELDFEAEEVSIINATNSTTGPAPLVHLVVEESGALAPLSERLDGRDGAFEVLHISCHGDIIAPKGPDGVRDGAERPVLILETEEGDAHEVSAPDLIGTCQDTLPPLMFVSACRTAQSGGPDTLRDAVGMRRDGPGEAPGLLPGRLRARDMAGDAAGPAAEAAEPYVLELVRGVANVVGWDGSVYDHDATAFATSFYGALSNGRDVPTAAAMARRDLLLAQGQDPRNGRHWHLARVYLGAAGGGPICRPGLDTRDAPVAEPAFLDSENRIKVAGRDTFVGRRRTVQHAVAILRRGSRALLAHGIGNLGKSSLAARIAGRLTGYETVVVVSPKETPGSANARVIFGQLKSAVDAMADALPWDSAEARTLRNDIAKMEADLADRPERFEAILRTLLAGPFKTSPVFLVLDDFENSLETPTSEAPVVQPKAHLLADLRAVFRAFAGPGVTSRLMVTCRYDFILPDAQGTDLTTPFLERLPLTPMSERERVKQWQARERARKTDAGETAAEIDGTLVQRLLAASGGNPGLQEVLTQPLLRGAGDEVDAALATVEAFLESGEAPPEEEDIGDFFTRMTFEVYEGALDGTTRLALSVARAFSPGVPIPQAALTAGMAAVGIAAAEAALERLLALGLMDDHGPQAGWPHMAKTRHAAINPLARPLAEAPDDDSLTAIAQEALPALAAAWQDDEGDFPYDLRAVEATLQALRAPAPDGAWLDAAATGAVIFLFELSQNAPAAVALAEPVFAKLAALAHPPSAPLLGHSIKAAERVGAVALQDRLLDAALARTDIEDRLMAQLKGLYGDRLMRRGDLDAALRIRETEQLPVYEALGDTREIAITKGKIADIMEVRGDLDGALQIHETELLPAFEALGDTRAIAVTKGKIADILETRGDLDGALHIRKTEQLPVYEAIGDKREIAVAKGQISDILETRGDLDGALRIRQTEVLPAFEALGDPRLVAVEKGKIADILQTRGDLDAALRIRETEQLPVYEALGDTRAIAITKGKIADILQTRGDLDGTLSLRETEVLPAFEALGDPRLVAVEKGKIADILQTRGDLDAALHLRETDVLRVYEALGDKRAIAVTNGKIADILQARGDLDGALDMHLSRLPTAEAMQDLEGLVHIKFSCARIRLERGDHETDGIQIIFEELDAAFRGAVQLQRPDFIGAIGPLLAQILAAGGAKDAAHNVLDFAAQAFETMGDEDGRAHVTQLRGMIGERDAPDA
ncbi:MAG: CHAT domain-containing protein [Rhodobacter sp.]|nr:CHAT domain-containing protein [Rhodobacter sp.]